VRFFKILFSDSIKITTEYKLRFMGRTVPLETTFLSILYDIELTFPCSARNLELVIKTYLDLIEEETLCVYGLDKDVDFYIDTKLRCYPPNIIKDIK
jgi:hypothetical protein